MKFIKILLNLLLSFFLLALILWGIAFTVLQSEKGQHWALEKMASIVEEKTGAQIKVEKIELFLPFTFRLHSLQIKKDEDLDLVFDQIDVNYTSPKLLEGRLAFNNIEAKGVFINKIPLTISLEQSGENTAISLEHFYIKIKHFQIKDLHINPQIISQLLYYSISEDIFKNAIFSLEGHFRNISSGAGLDLGILVGIENHTLSKDPIQLDLNLKNESLNVNLDLKKMPLDIFKEELKNYTANIHCEARGELSQWKNILNNTSNRVVTQFKINAFNFNSQDIIAEWVGKEIILSGELTNFSKENIRFKNTKLSGTDLELLAEGEISEFKNIEYFRLSGFYKKLDLNFESQIQKNKLVFDLLHDNERYLVSTDFDYNESEVRLDRLSIKSDHSIANGRINLNISTLLSEGFLDFSISNLNVFSSYVSKKIEGQLQGRLLLAKNQSHNHLQNFILEANGENLAFNEWRSLKGEMSLKSTLDLNNFETYNPSQSKIILQDFKANHFTVGSLKIVSNQDISYALFNLKEIDAQIFANKVSLENNQFEDLSLQATIKNLEYPYEGKIKGIAKEIMTSKINSKQLIFETTLSQNDNAFILETNGLSFHSSSLKLKGLWSYKQNNFTFGINQCEGKVGTHPFSLMNSFQLIYNNSDTFSVTPFKFKFDSGKFEGQLISHNSQFNMHCEGTDVPTELLQLFNKDLPITGEFSFQTDLQGSLKNPIGKVSIALHKMQITEDIFAGKAFIQGKLDLDITPSAANLNAILSGIGKNPIIAKGTLPLDLSLNPFNFSFNEKKHFEMVLKAEGELDPYLHLFFNDTTNLSGQTKISLTLFGNINNPEIKGEIDLFHGTYESLNTGAIFKNIRARIEGNGSQLILKNFFAQDTKQGNINAEGYISLDRSKNYPFSFRIHPKHIFVIDSDYSSIAASGELILSGDKNGGVIRGRLTADSAIIRMEEALPTQIKTVEVRYVSSKDEAKTQPPTNENKWPLTLEIQGHLPRNVVITGKKLQSEWKGDLLITGNPSNPFINGELRVVNGEYDFNGKIFALTQGTIHFAGQADKKTSIYVVASKEIDKIKADIIVKGPTSKLAVSFRSNPPLSQREILSYILFNRGIADITPDQGDMLSQSFMELNDSEQTQTDFLTRLRTNMGIDRLDFGTGDGMNKDLSLQIGKYIKEGVMVSINKGLNASNGVAIEAKLHKNIQVQGEISDNAEGKVQLRWKKDY